MRLILFFLAFTFSLNGNVLTPDREYFSPLRNFSVRVISLEPSAFENTKALIIKCQNAKWELGLSKNSRTYAVEWSPKEKYLVIFNCAVSKESEVIYIKLSHDRNELKVIKKHFDLTERVSWEVIKWDENDSQVLMKKTSEDTGDQEVWIDILGKADH